MAKLLGLLVILIVATSKQSKWEKIIFSKEDGSDLPLPWGVLQHDEIETWAILSQKGRSQDEEGIYDLTTLKRLFAEDGGDSAETSSEDDSSSEEEENRDSVNEEDGELDSLMMSFEGFDESDDWLMPLAHDEGPSREGRGEYCYSRERDPYLGFATMTPYKGVPRLNANDLVPADCTPRSIWLLIRPGSYSPAKNDMERFEDHLPSLRDSIILSHSLGNGKLCPEDLNQLQNWNLCDMEMGPQGTLTPEGQEQIQGIATRFKEAFPGLVHQPFTLDFEEGTGVRIPGRGTRFAYAPSRQTYESTVAFVKALYGDVWGHMQLSHTGNEGLQYIDLCVKYIQDVLLKPKDSKPYHAFRNGKEMEEVRKIVSERLGFNMTIPWIRTMYNACRFMKAWNPSRPSPWCVAFTPRDLKVLEYWEDLRLHHDHGYGHKIAYKPACHIARNLTASFKDVWQRKAKINGTVLFVNAEVFIPFAALLGLFQDDHPLTGDTIKGTRLWRTSRFAGFGSNLAFILSSCEDDEWWVSVALNEVSIEVPGCESRKGCSWEEFVSEFSFKNCNISKICGKLLAENAWQLKNWQRYYSGHDWL